MWEFIQQTCCLEETSVCNMPNLSSVTHNLVWPQRESSQTGSTSMSCSIREARTNVLLPTQLKVTPERLAFSSANINEWQRSSCCAYQVSSGVSHGSQGTVQMDFLSRKNKERRHGICPESPWYTAGSPMLDTDKQLFSKTHTPK